MRIVEGRLAAVQADVANVQAGLLVDLDLRILDEIRDGSEGRRRGQVDLPALQSRQPAGFLADQGHRHGLDLRRAVEVVRERLQLDAASGLPLLEHIGAGADRVEIELVAQRLDRLPRHDLRTRARVGQIGQQRCERLVRDDPNGVGVRRFDRLDGRKLGAVRRGRLFIQHALKRELHVVGRQFASVVELHAFAKLEFQRGGIDKRIAFGQIRDDLHFLVEFDKRVEHGPDNITFRKLRDLGRIERVDDRVPGDRRAKQRGRRLRRR